MKNNMAGERSLGFNILVFVLYVFLLAPIAIVFPLSFSGDTYLIFPPTSWSLRWYPAILGSEPIMRGFFTSLQLASAVTVMSLLVGVPAAYAIARKQFLGKDLILSLFTAPLMLPTIVLGLAILLVFVQVGILATGIGLALAHMIVTTPYVVRIVVTALGGINGAIEEAARTLGAPPWQVFTRVTLPLITPGLVGAAALSFLVSFDEVVISLFITGPSITTLPVEMFNYVETKADPLVAAVSALLIVVTTLLILLIEKSMGLSRALGK